MRVSVIAISVAFATLVMISCGTNRGDFRLVNKANELIARVLVTVCGQTIELKDIQPAQSVPGSYTVKSDSHFDIRVEFQSGKKLQKEMGYVTNGMDFHHEFVVTDTDIEIIDSKAKVQ